jgi:hypothetical protein
VRRHDVGLEAIHQLLGDKQQGHLPLRLGVHERFRRCHNHAGNLGDGERATLLRQLLFELGGEGGKLGHGRPLLIIIQRKPLDCLRLVPKLLGGDEGFGRILGQGDRLTGDYLRFLACHRCLLAIARWQSLIRERAGPRCSCFFSAWESVYLLASDHAF